jgi:hypothetical protein
MSAPGRAHLRDVLHACLPRPRIPSDAREPQAVIDLIRAATALFRVDNPRMRSASACGPTSARRGGGGGRRHDPREAVLEGAGKRFVYVLRPGKTERREVTLGGEHGDTVAILSGLKPGERVVTRAYQLYLQELRPAAPGAHTHET